MPTGGEPAKHAQSQAATTSAGRTAWRAFVVWAAVILAESVLGGLREALLRPHMGDMPARRVGLFVSLVMIFAITLAAARWLNGPVDAARRGRTLAWIGLGWAGATVAFEVALGLALGYSMDRITSDYNLARGGLMPLGLVFLACCPLLAWKLLNRRSPTK